MKITGACHCGAITIEGEADPEKVGICHCTDCQTGTGSAFRVSVPVAVTVPASRRRNRVAALGLRHSSRGSLRRGAGRECDP